MKLFKTIDEKFDDIGFTKMKETPFGVSYARVNSTYMFVQQLDLLYKASGRHLVQSYDRDLMDEKKTGNTCVGLSMYEMKLCLRKMKQMGYKEIE